MPDAMVIVTHDRSESRWSVVARARAGHAAGMSASARSRFFVRDPANDARASVQLVETGLRLHSLVGTMRLGSATKQWSGQLEPIRTLHTSQHLDVAVTCCWNVAENMAKRSSRSVSRLDFSRARRPGRVRGRTTHRQGRRMHVDRNSLT